MPTTLNEVASEGLPPEVTGVQWEFARDDEPPTPSETECRWHAIDGAIKGWAVANPDWVRVRRVMTEWDDWECVACRANPASKAALLVQVAKAAAAADTADSALRDCIRAATDSGLPLRAVGEAAGVSHQTVANILNQTP